MAMNSISIKGAVLPYVIFLHLIMLFACLELKGQMSIPVLYDHINDNEAIQIDLDTCIIEYPSTDIGALNQTITYPGKISLEIDPNKCKGWKTKGDLRYIKLCFYHPLAEEMAFVLAPYKVSNGVNIIFYNDNGEVLLGALSALNNKKSKVLPIRYLKGNRIFMEVQVPNSVSDPGTFTIRTVFITHLKRDKRSINREICHNEISCFDLPVIDKAKEGIFRIKISGYKDCSGALINNCNNDGTPYAITANHCIDSQEEADNAVFIFQDEKVACDCETQLPQKSISSATLISTSKEHDLTLLQLSVAPDASYNPLYLGWNISAETHSNVACIHHREGGDKKFALDVNRIERASFDEVVDYFAKNAHWKVNRWEIGSTGRGASGAPLLDQEGRIIGILSGGEATCSNPVNDYFADISSGWSSPKDSSVNLMHWLDPEHKTTGKLEAYRPFEKSKSYFFNTCDTSALVDDGFYVYPTYFDNHVIIFSDEYVESELTLINLLGQREESIHIVLKPGDNIIPINNRRGIYLLSFDNKRKVFKVFKR